MRITIVTSVSGFLLWLAAIGVLGVIGVYVGFLLQMAVRMFGAVLCARRTWGIQIAWEGVLIALILLSAGAWVSAILAEVKL